MDIELAIDMLEMAQHLDHAILFSGDGDFRRLVAAVQRRGVRVSVVSTIRSSPPMAGVGRFAPPGRQLHRVAGTGAQHHAQPSSARRAWGAPAHRAGRLSDPNPCHCEEATGPTRQSRSAERLRARDRFAALAMTPAAPGRDCPLCPRLAAFRAASGGRIPTGSTRRCRASAIRRPALLMVGLAPGLRGANRTGRPFTGDFGGDLLDPHLAKFGFAAASYGAHPKDGLQLVRTRITNAVRCAAAEQAGSERNRRPPAVRGRAGGVAGDRRRLLALGAIAHNAVLAAKGLLARDSPLCAWRDAQPAGWDGARRQLSLLAAQHQYRPAHRGDVRTGGRRDRRAN